MFASLHCKAVCASSNCKGQVFLKDFLHGPNSSRLLWWMGDPWLFQKQQKQAKLLGTPLLHLARTAVILSLQKHRLSPQL